MYLRGSIDTIHEHIADEHCLQEDFTLMMSVTLEKAARNVLMDRLYHLTKRQGHQSKIASPVQKVTIEISRKMLGFDPSEHLLLIIT